MAGALNWNALTVVSSSGETFETVQTIIRSNEAKLTGKGGGIVASKSGVVSIAQVQGFPTTKRLVTFEDGTTWLVSRKRGCNCR